MYLSGLPAPQLPFTIDLNRKSNGKLNALIWQNGDYSIRGHKQTIALGQISGCSASEVTGAWKVKPGSLPEIILPSLISLHKHKDFNVMHFSGTATYIKNIVISKSDLQSGNKLFLHLGRVEVIAEVKVNGRKLPILWKEPFMVEITNVVKEGHNNVEISVTNLWPNRMIGDEHLPKENEYSIHNFVEKLPDWYVNNQPKPGERTTFSAWHNYEKTSPLFESGLLGPVKLLRAIEKEI